MRVAVPVVKSGEKLLLVSHFGRAPSFAVAEVKEGKYEVVEVFENPHIAHEHGRGAAVIDALVKRGGGRGPHTGDRLRRLLQAQKPRGEDLLRQPSSRQKHRHPAGDAQHARLRGSRGSCRAPGGRGALGLIKGARG
uniref:Dinitrogenase iron-molybdenum cofactor biosynthesis domain-containing protein n=1 Tax=Thermofilum pendens TaxID=2269 RepID=A0A7C4FFN2_THEPE